MAGDHVMNVFKEQELTVDNAQRRRFAMNRRATLRLVIAGVAGIASSSTAISAEFLRKKGSGRTSTAPAHDVGGARAMKTGLAPQFRNLKKVGPDRQVVTIYHVQDAYTVTTADGRSTDFREANLRFKIDSSDIGPPTGKPVILPSGMMGDRASVFFASPAEMSAAIKHQG
jgi:cytochrome c